MVDVVQPPKDILSRNVLIGSQVYKDLPDRARARLIRLKRAEWLAVDQAIASLGNVLVLAVRDLNDPELLQAVYSVKMWAIKHTLYGQLDQVTSYLKWLAKASHGVALGVVHPPGEAFYPGYNKVLERVSWTPFQGPELRWLDSLLLTGVRQQLTLEQYRACAQIAALARALPYPTDRQVRRSVAETISIITTPKEVIPDDTLLAYRGGLRQIAANLGPPRVRRSHSSLVASGCIEASRSDGGRGTFISQETRALSSLILDSDLCRQLAGKVDAFGEVILSASVHAWLLSRGYDLWLEAGEEKTLLRGLTLGDVAYISLDDLPGHLEAAARGRREVPPQVGALVALWATADVMDIGHYVPAPAMLVGAGRATFDGSPLDQPFPVWEFASREEITFFPLLDSLPVKSALSIEAGGKTRLVTAGLAAVAQLGQLVRHPIAEWLGLDQTLRVGFEEPDKLWEVLKAFQKGGGQPSEDWWIISTDLKEATYNMSFQLLDLNLELIDQQFAGLRPWKVFSRLFKVHRRTVLLNELKEKGYLPPDHPDQIDSLTGAFMGDSLSFMHLTITLTACSLVAGFAAQSRWDHPKWSHLGDGFVHRPYMQIVGDDHLAVGATARYCQVFRQTVERLQLVLSKIDAVNRWFGTFAENSFCIPSDLGELQDYNKGSKFGSLLFLDVIKGSILAGQAKVKGDGQSPFIGHAKMLSTQIEWHPIAFVRGRAPVLIGLRNFRESKGLAIANPYFPLELGGLGIPLGTLRDFDDPDMQRQFAAYLESMLQADEEEFRVCWLLLQSVSKPSPKGVPWEASPEMLTSIVSKLETVAEGPVMANLPSYIADKGRSTMAKYLQSEYGLLSLRSLTDHLARRKAFEDFWLGRASEPNYLQLGAAEYRRRFRSVWSELRRRLRPVEVVTLSSLREAAKKVQQRTFGLLFSEEDPAITDYFHGMGSLAVIYGQQRL